MRLFSICVMILFLNSQAVGQENKYAITVTPALLPMGTIAIQPGFQVRLNERFALLSQITIPVSYRVKNDIEDSRFLRVSSELKLFPKRAIEGRFYSVQLGYHYRKFVDADSGVYKNDYMSTQATGYKNAVIRSSVFFINAGFGREIVYWKKFFLDYFFTVGLRFIPTKYDAEGKYAIVYQEKPKHGPMWFDHGRSWEEHRNYFRFGGGVGLRMGIRF